MVRIVKIVTSREMFQYSQNSKKKECQNCQNYPKRKMEEEKGVYCKTRKNIIQQNSKLANIVKVVTIVKTVKIVKNVNEL